ncbi:aldo/keto reductase [Rhizobium sp. CNPSo 3464]|uniref:aldo/keto reductase n=1 Tax=Rhizobium sp. CNPSo 3464 TaxID=3021406 RepID=UPI00254FCBF6|nr:aldo/keto reductase [Rhizobium sp. CNPSo 3464]MDK4740243.1 aldo/keto reductase [Rhizobium sp. CNPSo 3464]
MEYVTLNNGVQMPKLGLGVFRMDDAEVRKTVPVALEEGYRLIDTASRYYNEKAVGAALAESGVARTDLFVTTKLWFKDYGYEKTREAFKVSLDNLGLDYLDLYLMHQPFNDYYGAWRAMEELLDEGRVRAIGVSNFYADRFLDLVTHNRVIPAVNQRETHPLNQQVDTLALLKRHGTVLQAWGPLAQGNQGVLTSSALADIAAAHGKTVAQVILRWLVQRDVTMVVKSTRVARLRGNIDIFDFHLSEGEMSIIGSFDRQQPLAGFTHQDPRMLELLLTLA